MKMKLTRKEYYIVPVYNEIEIDENKLIEIILENLDDDDIVDELMSLFQMNKDKIKHEFIPDVMKKYEPAIDSVYLGGEIYENEYNVIDYTFYDMKPLEPFTAFNDKDIKKREKQSYIKQAIKYMRNKKIDRILE